MSWREPKNLRENTWLPRTPDFASWGWSDHRWRSCDRSFIGDSVAPVRLTSFGGQLFVLLWSTGYIAAGVALRGFAPFTLTTLRFVFTGLIIGAWLLLRRPAGAGATPRMLLHSAVAGVMLQAGFFGFTYVGLRAGASLASAGLISGLMPLVTTLGAALFLGEPLRPNTMVGLVLGLAGVLMVIGPGLYSGGSAIGDLLLGLALLSLSAGTLYQKRFGGSLDGRLSLLMQVTGSLLVTLPIAWIDGFRMASKPLEFVALAWMVVVNSCVTLLLYIWLIRRGDVGRVASLFYLVPPVTAILVAVVLHAHFGALDAAGFGTAALGVWLGQKGAPRNRSAEPDRPDLA